MTQSFLPLYSWGMGTALIIIFALVCIVLTIMVFKFVMSGKSKEQIEKERQEEIEKSKEEKL
ncbi:MAG TPA: hypothetical protein VK021_02280 [Flavobacteriaceae bacterium]|nr:hypothetical protein [Flavobacteriaceae bacterium]